MPLSQGPTPGGNPWVNQPVEHSAIFQTLLGGGEADVVAEILPNVVQRHGFNLHFGW